MISFTVPFVLASQSPRRSELLRRLGIPFEVRPSSIEEVAPEGAGPAEVVESLARQKVEAIVPQAPHALVLGADTVVVLDGLVLGKPADEAEAVMMLRRLSGQTHTVFTGIALAHSASGRFVTAHEATAVTFGSLSLEEAAAYAATGSPLDKAGGYGIQDDYGALFVEGVRGDYYNVVGLPLHRLYRLLRAEFSDLLAA